MKNPDNKPESVLHDWVHTLTFQQQALLMTGMRGPDGLNKHHPIKPLVRYLRGVVLKAAGDWSGKNNNDFMWGEFDKFHTYASIVVDDHDDVPHHFLMHLIHCIQVVGYKHPDDSISSQFAVLYHAFCESMHMEPESELCMDLRLNDFGRFFTPSKAVAS